MGSSTEKAQRLANEANIQMTRETNQQNYDIAHEANLWNWSNLQAQNEWNIQQWERENEYNDPSKQMERLIKAGINPIFAMGAIDSGNAQHLESGAPAPAEVARMEAPQVQPEYDPMLAQHVGNLVASARDLINAGQGFERIALEREDVKTRRASQLSRSVLDSASAAEKRANTTGREIQNQWDLQTFGVRSQSETQKLNNLIKEYDKMDADTEQAKAMRLKIDEDRKLITEQINATIVGIEQRNRQLSIMQQQVALGNRQADIADARLQFDQVNAESNRQFEQTKFKAQLAQWDNDNLLRYMDKFGQTLTGEFKGSVGTDGLGFSAGGSSRQTLPATRQQAIDCGIQVLRNYANDPSSPDKQRDAQKAADYIKILQEQQARKYVVPVDQLFNSTHSSVLNPSGSDW